ncbi:hypothetical protein [Stenotrophomonas sp. NA06056]|uniref:hypothetical protein n=1 Tax=Stenotrophomonas sp. NA06056 TaxID=2742129 RepID=UPI00158C6FB1|nr:hypothetical protein [Stenotrophomonas sp. NA06056]QKW58626.1 hypothetical protein HUT07_19250 [Stenotrophomonas sp. NA06056]
MRSRTSMIPGHYFKTDDGSLPEVEVTFAVPAHMVAAFAHLFACGARDATRGGGQLWASGKPSVRQFSGLEDAERLGSGESEPFHLLLEGIVRQGTRLPDLGVLVTADGFTVDYRMGATWQDAEIRAFLSLLGDLRALGGSVSVPWWGEGGQRDFQQALAR